MAEIKVMKPFINGEFIESKSEKFNTIYDPSTGHEIAKVPCCTKEEVESAIAAAKADPTIAGLLEGKTIIKELYVKGKLVNIVAK